MKTKVLASLVGLAIALGSSTSATAAGWSLREKGYVKKIPESFAKHAGGITLAPTDADVADALALGVAFKEKSEPIDYAYLFKADSGAFASDAIYVTVATPLYLIAAHARDQTRDYRKVDDAFVAAARNLGAVRLSLNQQFLTARYRMVALSYSVILLRDGVRVDPLHELLGWRGGNPFLTQAGANVSSPAIEAVQRTAMQTVRASMVNMDDATKRMMIGQLAATGWSDARICDALGWTPKELDRVRGQAIGADGKPVPIPLSENDAVFAIEELRKPGKYEMVFRQPTVGFFGELKDKEVRFPISFDRFR